MSAITPDMFCKNRKCLTRYERAWPSHGTSEETASEIIAQGFNRNYGFQEVNKDVLTMYGKGVYFAVNSSYRQVTHTVSPTAQRSKSCLCVGSLLESTVRGQRTSPNQMCAGQISL
jgi:hypothetical protein